MNPVFKPSKEQVAAALGQAVPDVLAPALPILFVGINPSLYSAAVGHHFGRPGNRFWKGLRAGGLTPRLLSPFEEDLLPTLGMGITNLVDGATATAAEVTVDELRAGARVLEAKVQALAPRIVAFLGIQMYRDAYGLPRATVGPQPETIAGARVWVLPNPSGLNAHFQVDALGRLFAQLRQAAFGAGGPARAEAAIPSA